MTALMTTFRLAVQEQLATVLQIPVVPGRLEGHQGRTDIGCVFPDNTEEVEGDVWAQNLSVTVRVFKKADERRREPQRPLDPTPLEDMAELIQTGLDNIQASAGPWFFRVTSVEYDLEAQMVEASVLGFAANAFGSSA